MHLLDEDEQSFRGVDLATVEASRTVVLSFIDLDRLGLV